VTFGNGTQVAALRDGRLLVNDPPGGTIVRTTSAPQ
jgi:hypothetical protein